MTESKQKSCGLCSKAFGVPPEGGVQVTCDGPCKKSFHLQCADLSMSLLQVRAAKLGLLWFCSNCRLDFDDGVLRRESALENTIRMMFDEVRKTVGDLTIRVDSIDENFKQFNQTVAVKRADASSQVEEADQSQRPVSISSPEIEEPEIKHCINTELVTSNELIITEKQVDKSPIGKKGAKISGQEKSEKELSAKYWVKVFEYLDFEDLCQIRLVNSEWKKMVDSNRSCMGKFISKYPKDVIIDRDFEAVPMLPASTISFNNASIAAIGSWWSRTAETLVNLELNNCKISLVNLLEMLRLTPNLISLNLGCGSTLKYYQNIDKYADFKLRELKSLTLDTVKQSELMELFVRIFPGLTDLKLLQKLDENHNISNVIETIKGLEGISLVSSSRILPKMKKEFKRVSLEIPVVDECCNEDIICFSKSQSDLKSFHIKVSGVIRTHGQYGPNDSYLLNDKILTELFPNLLSLERLFLSFSRVVLNEQVVKLDFKAISCLTELKYLAFHGTNTNIRQEISFIGAQSPKLEELHLVRIKHPSNSTEFALQEYIEGAKNLRTIILEHCILFSWLDLFVPIQLKEFCRLKLSSVSAKDCDLYEYFDELRYLELAGCTMSEKMLSTMIRLCPRVEELHLSQMQGATDAVIRMVCQKMKQLRKLILHECPITDAALECIVEHGRNLKHLEIASSGTLTSGAKAQLKKVGILVLQIE